MIVLNIIKYWSHLLLLSIFIFSLILTLSFILQFIADPVSEEGNLAPVHLPLCVIEDVKPAIKGK